MEPRDPSAREGDPIGTPTAAVGPELTLAGASAGADTGATKTRARDEPLTRGRTVGRYVIVDRLGAGGMGVVYRAFDPDLDRSIALKLVRVDHDRGADERNRLLREAQAMARVAHPNVIPVFDVGIEGDVVFVAMELVEGTTLTRWCRSAPRAWQDVVACFTQAAAGLAAAHAAGLIHRDFKPDNVMVGTGGRVRVLDFGLARQDAASAPLRREHETTGELRTTGGRSSGIVPVLSQEITIAGAVMGTPAYMSPEQHLGAPALAASDQFSFCVALWEALYRERPFAGDTLAALAMNVVNGRLSEPRASDVPRWIHAALVRGLASDDQARFPTMDALIVALARDPRRRPRRVAIAGLGTIGVLGLGVALGVGLADDDEIDALPASPCSGSEDAIAGIWNDGRRRSIAAAFDGSGLAFAPAVADAVADRVDAYTTRWVDARTENCMATRVTGEQSERRMELRMRCLDRRRAELDALLGALARRDAAVVERALDAAYRLVDVATCSDPPEDGSDDATDPAVQATIDRAEPVLADVRAALLLGRYAEASLRLGPLSVTAQLVDAPRLQSRVFDLVAEVDEDTGRPDAGRAARERAFNASLAFDDPAQSAGLASHLAYSDGYVRADLTAGQRWLAAGRSLARRVVDSGDLLASLDAAEGAMLVAAGRYEESIAAQHRALAHWTVTDPDGPAVARTLDDIGAALVRLGKVDEAVANHRRAIDLRVRIYGDEHPVVASSRRELGRALDQAGRADEAKIELDRALAIQRAARGSHNAQVATLLDDLGRIARRKGDLDTALAHHREALAIWETVLGDPHQDVAVSLLNIGYTLVAARRPAEAVPIDERALAMFERTVGAQHPFIVYAGNALGMARSSSGDHAGAITALGRALALRGKVEVDPTLFGDTLFALAKAETAIAMTQAERHTARARAIQARALFATQGDRWTAEIAEIDAWLAKPS